MIKKRKMGILLILIGIGIPLVLAFFQDDGKLNLGSPTYKVIERKLTPTEIEAIEEKMAAEGAWRKALDNKKVLTEDKYYIRWMLALKPIDKKLKENVNKEIWVINSKVRFVIPFKFFVGIGIILILSGIGMLIFSFFSKSTYGRR